MHAPIPLSTDILSSPPPMTPPPPCNAIQLEDCRQQVAALEASQAAAAAEYERLLARNAAELDGLKAARGAELTAAVVRRARCAQRGRAPVLSGACLCCWLEAGAACLVGGFASMSINQLPRARRRPHPQAHLAGVAYSHEQQAAAGWQATCAALPTMQGGPVTAYMAQRFFKPQA